MNRLDQLFAQSQREIEAHAVEIAATATGRYYIDEAAHLLTGLRMWAQAQYRSDQVVREILEAGDATALQQVARELRLMKNREATVASLPVEAIAKCRRPPRSEHHRRPDAETVVRAQPTGADFSDGPLGPAACPVQR